MCDIRVNHPKKSQPIRWDPLNAEYPVNKRCETGKSSTTIAHSFKGHPEVLTAPRRLHEELMYSRQHTTDWARVASQSTVDFTQKAPQNVRFNKHTASSENQYIALPGFRCSDRVPAVRAHGTSEMRDSYRRPRTPPTMSFDKYRQQLGSYGFTIEDPPTDWPMSKHLDTIDTSEESPLIHLDPYVTSSRQHHRPFTAEQLGRPSNTRDIVTFHTLSPDPWVRTRKPHPPEIRPRTSKAMVDRETFRQATREVRTHNKMAWVPGCFRTEVRDNYKKRLPIPNNEHVVQNTYKATVSDMETDPDEIQTALKNTYFSENNHIGSAKSLSTVLDQYVWKNKRLEKYSFR